MTRRHSDIEEEDSNDGWIKVENRKKSKRRKQDNYNGSQVIPLNPKVPEQFNFTKNDGPVPFSPPKPGIQVPKEMAEAKDVPVIIIDTVSDSNSDSEGTYEDSVDDGITQEGHNEDDGPATKCVDIPLSQESGDNDDYDKTADEDTANDDEIAIPDLVTASDIHDCQLKSDEVVAAAQEATTAAIKAAIETIAADEVFQEPNLTSRISKSSSASDLVVISKGPSPSSSVDGDGLEVTIKSQEQPLRQPLKTRVYNAIESRLKENLLVTLVEQTLHLFSNQ